MTFDLGDGVYLPANTHRFAVRSHSSQKIKKIPSVSQLILLKHPRHHISELTPFLLQIYEDEEKYSELYRRSSDYVKGSNLDAPKPFQIGETITTSNCLLFLIASQLYTLIFNQFPENIFLVPISISCDHRSYKGHIPAEWEQVDPGISTLFEARHVLPAGGHPQRSGGREGGRHLPPLLGR